jgi:protease I
MNEKGTTMPSTRLDGLRVAALLTDGFEDSELSEPVRALRDAGADVRIVSPKAGQIEGKKGASVSVDLTVDQAKVTDFDALLIPGGLKNPDTLRQDERAVRLVREFFDTAKPIASICHGPWMLVEADVVRGRRLTSFPSLQTDIRNAGGEWIDAVVVNDQGLVTSRTPDDLPQFIEKMLEEFAEGEHARRFATAGATTAR